jgi:hypothetical protein
MLLLPRSIDGSACLWAALAKTYDWLDDVLASMKPEKRKPPDDPS